MSMFIPIFKSLSRPVGVQAGVIEYAGQEIENYRGCHVCKDQYNRPAVLFSTQANRELVPPSIAIENLQVEHGIECQLSLANGQRFQGNYTVISCLSSNVTLHEYFLETMETITRTLSPNASAREIASAIEKLIELFQAMRRAPRGSVMGLWAELFVIMASADPLVLIQAWHSDPNECFDFSAGMQRIEVKSAGDRIRDHFFSYEQAYPPDDVEVVVVSLFVEASTNGTTLGKLWDAARLAVGTNEEMRMKIERICFETLGSSWPDARTKSYDQQLAIKSMSYFNVRDIPRITEDQPTEVTDIHFRSDISDVGPININKYRASENIFRSLFGCDEKSTKDNY